MPNAGGDKQRVQLYIFEFTNKEYIDKIIERDSV
jgi:hypothetical protein